MVKGLYTSRDSIIWGFFLSERFADIATDTIASSSALCLVKAEAITLVMAYWIIVDFAAKGAVASSEAASLSLVFEVEAGRSAGSSAEVAKEVAFVAVAIIFGACWRRTAGFVTSGAVGADF